VQLPQSVSLNRVRIVDLPGLALEDDIRGRLAFDLLSPKAVIALIRDEAAALALTADALAGPALLPTHFDRCFVAAPAVRAAAERVARRMGRRLAYLLLTLKRGDAVNRAARLDWDDAYWAHWATVERIWFGGGLLSGRLGQRMLAQARLTLAEAGYGACRLRRARYPAILPLIGAARSAQRGAHPAVVVDFGQSFVKRALAIYAGDALAALHLLPSVPTYLADLRADPPEDLAPHVAEMMITVLVQTWREVEALHRPLAPVLVASIAAYVAGNQPLPTQAGTYVTLHKLTDNAGRWLGEQVSARLGRTVAVELIHDGTAAARVYAGHPHSAVIVLGTALGVGFPPPPGGLRLLAPQFQVTSPT
jgi:hypothetical protein